MAGNSGLAPPAPNESRFVVDEERGRLDVLLDITESVRVAEVYMPTTRCVGTVDSDGFLPYGGDAIKAGRLAGTMMLTIRAKITAFDAGGILGQDGIDVEVFLHLNQRGETSLGTLSGDYGSDWQNFTLEVNTLDLTFPADPCPNQSSSFPCGQRIKTRLNKVSFVFSGTARMGLEIDWMTLEPKSAAGLASRPVLLLHGWEQSAADMGRTTVWADQLTGRDIPWYAADLSPRGRPQLNAGEVAAAVSDMQQRFGVQRVNIVGFGKGGIDARVYASQHNGAETLIMLASPNDGTSIAGLTSPVLYFTLSNDFWMSSWGVELINDYPRNPHVLYVAISASYDSEWAQSVASWYGPNDEVVTTASVGALPYAQNRGPYQTSVNDSESEGTCADQLLTNHSCLRYNAAIVSTELPVFLEPPGAPLPTGPQPLPQFRVTSSPLDPAKAEGGGVDVLQGITSASSDVPSAGLTQAHEAFVDTVEEARFYAFAGGNVLNLQLVSPSGVRIDPTTSAGDASVGYIPLLDAEVCWYTGYQIKNPEQGTWTLEVTGTSTVPAASQYAVTAFALPPDDLGVAMSLALGREAYAIGDEVILGVTLTADGCPVTNANVTAQVRSPDGVVTSPTALSPDGAADDGAYVGAFAGTALPGPYTIVVTAEGTDPKFSRQQAVQVNVAPSVTSFTGQMVDSGVDLDDLGRYGGLEIDVGVNVDVAAAYRVFGTLTDVGGTAIEQVRTVLSLQPGIQTVSLLFDGARLFDLGLDGPYVLVDLVIEDVATHTVLARRAPYTTATYTW